MSRFDRSRWNRILVWTGAALAWGTALIAARVEPNGPTESAQPSEVQVASIFPQAAMPTAPSQGLVILRFTRVETPEPEVLTVTVGRAAASSSPPAQAAAVAQSAPAPSSSGS